jgi:RNA polymerase sigma-70 factor (ECF subfamily)
MWDATTTDEELVLLTQRGERAAFGALYDRYLGRVYAYCYRVLGSREAAEDANTEVFMRALMGLPAYRAGSFRSWLFAIAHNVVTDEVRRRPTAPLTAAMHLVDTKPSPDEVATAYGDHATLMAALRQLSDDQYQVIALRLAGLSAVQIGEVLGKPRNAIDGLHHRALLRLRALVATTEPVVTKGGG